MKKPSVSVCIPTYNQARFLRLAVASALAQVDCDVEVWVSDDCSTDETAEVMSVFSGDPRVHYHRWGKNQGIAKNAAWVMEQGGTEFLIRLDSDDLLHADYCARLIGYLQENPTAGVAHASVREIDQHDGYRRVRRLARSSGFQAPDEAIRQGVSSYRVAANICMFRRAALAQVAPIYRLGLNFCEDWDLFLRLAAAGWGNIYCHDVLASYRVWTDIGGYRKGRKVTELNGARSVYEETLHPEYVRRGWPLAEIARARKSLACAHVRALRGIPLKSEDYGRVRLALIALGDGPGLRFRLALTTMRLGWMLDAWAWLYVKARDMAKALLGAFRTVAG